MSPRRLAAWLCSLALSALPYAAAAQAAGPTVQTADGPVQGRMQPDGVAVFMGIPFAKPPLGPLRWRPPEPPTPWSAPRDATAEPPPCLQPDQGWNSKLLSKSSEDCLYLDVGTPSLKADAKLPVMVWIHGGSNVAGSADRDVSKGLPKRGVVLVTIQYRLGVFGFLSHPGLDAEQGGSSGNYALMDQIAALKWVKANIARFGGDPDKVTLAGQSAGAEDVGLLSVSPLTRDLFIRTIQESGSAGFGSQPWTQAESDAAGVELAKLAGVPAGPGAIAALREIPSDRLLSAQAKLAGEPAMGALWMHAVIDGRVLPEAPAAVFASHRRLRPALLGWNAQEAMAFGPQPRAAVTALFGEPGVKALAFYTGPDPLRGDVAMQVGTDFVFRCPVTVTAEAVTASGSPTWMYQFDLSRDSGPVAHSAELPYVFEDRPAGGLSVQAYWTNFVKTGDPNRPALAPWPRFGPDRRVIEFSAEGPKIITEPKPQVCDLIGRL